MTYIDSQYENLLQDVLLTGTIKGDRTGTGTRSVFGRQIRYDLSKGFPLITTKRVFWKGVVHELLWLLAGDTNVKYLQDNGVHIWDEWADENGRLGPVYGQQWRGWLNDKGEEIDQIAGVIESLKNNPDSRRHIVSAWNVGELDQMKLPPCHAFFQFYVADGKLSCQLYQRSADLFLGVPFNIASYALLTHIIAAQTGLGVGEFVHTFGDAHIYENHVDQVQEQLSREGRPFPTLRMEQRNTAFDHRAEDFSLIEYHPHPAIKAEVAV